MPDQPVSVTRSGPGRRQLLERMRALRKSEVYVGIPSEKTGRTETFSMSVPQAQKTDWSGRFRRQRMTTVRVKIASFINNASLLFIHTHGSALNNIPARPVIEPANQDPENRKPIVAELAAAAKAMANGDPVKGRQHLRRAGIVAANAARAWFTNPRNGWAPNTAETIRCKGSDKPMIDTEQMRRAITSVVSDAGRLSPEEQVETGELE